MAHLSHPIASQAVADQVSESEVGIGVVGDQCPRLALDMVKRCRPLVSGGQVDGHIKAAQLAHPAITLVDRKAARPRDGELAVSIALLRTRCALAALTRTPSANNSSDSHVMQEHLSTPAALNRDERGGRTLRCGLGQSIRRWPSSRNWADQFFSLGPISPSNQRCLASG